MSNAHAITRTLTRSPLIAVVLYVAVIGGLLAIVGIADRKSTRLNSSH